MANIKRYSAAEALNISGGSGGEWTVNAVSSAHASTAAGSTIHLLLKTTTGQIGVYPAGDIYFNFSKTATDCTAANDLVLPANTLTFVTIPRGLGSTLYFNHLGVAATTVKTVEV